MFVVCAEIYGDIEEMHSALDQIDDESRELRFKSFHDSSFIYIIGERAQARGVSRRSSSIKQDCGTGIHFFMDKESAINFSGGHSGIVPVTSAPIYPLRAR